MPHMLYHHSKETEDFHVVIFVVNLYIALAETDKLEILFNPLFLMLIIIHFNYKLLSLVI